MTDILAEFSSWFRPHLTFIASAQIATILVVYGERINKAVWSLMRGTHFIFRTLAFVALCAFGYGALAVYLVPILKDLFLIAGNLWLGPIIVLCFFIVGILAERQSRR